MLHPIPVRCRTGTLFLVNHVSRNGRTVIKLVFAFEPLSLRNFIGKADYRSLITSHHDSTPVHLQSWASGVILCNLDPSMKASRYYDLLDDNARLPSARSSTPQNHPNNNRTNTPCTSH